jgi:hypothetical protein
MRAIVRRPHVAGSFVAALGNRDRADAAFHGRRHVLLIEEAAIGAAESRGRAEDAVVMLQRGHHMGLVRRTSRGHFVWSDQTNCALGEKRFAAARAWAVRTLSRYAERRAMPCELAASWWWYWISLEFELIGLIGIVCLGLNRFAIGTRQGPVRSPSPRAFTVKFDCDTLRALLALLFVADRW